MQFVLVKSGQISLRRDWERVFVSPCVYGRDKHLNLTTYDGNANEVLGYPDQINCDGLSSHPEETWNFEVLVFPGGGNSVNQRILSDGTSNKPVKQHLTAGSGNRTQATLLRGERSHHCVTQWWSPAPIIDEL